MTPRKKVSIEKLREAVSYDPETGLFFRISGRFAGQQAFVSPMTGGYLRSYIAGEYMVAHRAAWAHYYGEWPDVIDHVNRDKTDNRIANLRKVSVSENAMNRSQAGYSNTGFVGVSLERHGRYQAKLTYQGKQIFRRRFKTLEEAVAAREAAVASLIKKGVLRAGIIPDVRKHKEAGE